MDMADCCDGPAQQAAQRRYDAVYSWARRHNGGSTPYPLHEYVEAHRPDLLPALDGLPCPGLTTLEVE